MNVASNHHMLLLTPPDADAMSGTELKAKIAEVFPGVGEAEALAYTEGAGRALLLAGMEAEDVSLFLTHWSGTDLRMYVGTLYGVVSMKQKAFAESLLTPKMVMPTPGMTQ